MPVINGLEATRVLRCLMPAVPLIMYSAFGDRYAGQQARLIAELVHFCCNASTAAIKSVAASDFNT